MKTELNFKELLQVMDREAKERQGIIYDMTVSPDCIMNCTREKLKDICSSFLTRIDDFQQLSANAGNNELLDFFVNSYNEIEKAYFHLKMGGLLSNQSRNELRSIIKESEKMASVQLDMEQYNEELDLFRQNIENCQKETV